MKTVLLGFWILLCTGSIAGCERDARINDGAIKIATTDTFWIPTTTLQPSIDAQAGAVPSVIETFSGQAPKRTSTIQSTASLDTSLGSTMVPTADTRLSPRVWATWPVVPLVTARVMEIYEDGIDKENKPNVFSSVGDCQSEPNVFLGIYETDRYYFTDDYSYLEQTIDYFRGSFSHKSQAVRDGLSAPSALSPMWANQEVCTSSENPVECELRLQKPIIMFVNLGTNWKAGASADAYEEYLRQIVTIIIDNGTIPVLSTKADNVEGDHSINRATANVAYQLDVPLWNFWLAADTLPNHGLDGSRENIYLTPDGWDRRNFTALLVLDSLWKGIEQQDGPEHNEN
jgi:hypothetical protein